MIMLLSAFDIHICCWWCCRYTNVQVKPHSTHDPKILKIIFTGFPHRAYATCKHNQREEEIDFLVRCFAENGHNENEQKKIAEKYHHKMTKSNNVGENQKKNNNTAIQQHRHSALDTRTNKNVYCNSVHTTMNCKIS